VRKFELKHGRLSLFQTQEKNKEAVGMYKHTLLYFAIETLMNHN